VWEPNVAALAARHRLILCEPRGHARSESPEDPTRVTFGHWVLDLHDLLEHLELERAVVGGLSLGGGIATRFTRKHPDRVRALSAPCCRWTTSPIGCPRSRCRRCSSAGTRTCRSGPCG